MTLRLSLVILHHHSLRIEVEQLAPTRLGLHGGTRIDTLSWTMLIDSTGEIFAELTSAMLTIRSTLFQCDQFKFSQAGEVQRCLQAYALLLRHGQHSG